MAQEIVQGIVYSVFHLAAGYAWFSYWQQRAWTRLDSILASLLLVIAQTIAGVFFLGWIGLFTTWSIWLWQLGCTIIVYWLCRRTFPRAWRVMRGYSWIEYSMGAIMGIVALVVMVLSFSSQDISFDSINYHLPWSAYVLQFGKIDYFVTLIPWINVYPKAIEAWQAWHMALWHDQSLLHVTNLIFWIIGGLAVYALARELKISRGASLIAGMSYCLIPLNLLILRTNYIDIALSSLTVLLLYWSTKTYDESWWLWSITAGILIGSKAPMLIIVAIALVVKLLLARQMPYKWPWYALVMIGFGSFFYVRNWWASGSPIFPIGPGLLSIQSLLEGSQAAVLKNIPWWEQFWLNSISVGGDYTYQMNPGGFGWLWLLALLPASCMCLAWAWKYRDYKIYVVLGALIIAFFVMPANWWLRYGIFVAAAGSISVAWVLDKLHHHWRHLLIAVVCLLCLQSIMITLHSWRPTRITDRFPELAGLEQISSAGSVVAYDGRLQTLFPLWNQNFSNRVVFISAADASYDQWRSLLQQDNVDYIVTKFPSIELQHITRNSQHFTLIRDNGDVKFWQVLK